MALYSISFIIIIGVVVAAAAAVVVGLHESMD